MKVSTLNFVYLLPLIIALSNCTKTNPQTSSQTTSQLSADARAQNVSTKKKTLTIGISQEPDSLFAPFKTMMASEEIFRVGNYSLTIFDKNWKIVPFAAKEIPTLANGKLELFNENGKQKMRSTWEIRDDFFWADGTPLTADDFVFANEIYKDPRLEIIDRSTTEKIEKMESKGADKKTLVVTWSEPYAYYHNYRQHEALPKHTLGPIYKASPESFSKNKYGQTPMLAGAYTIKEWVPGSHLVAERNPYAKGAFMPYFDEIVWRIIPQTNTLESNILSNTIDIISPLGLDLDQAVQFEKRHKDAYSFYYTSGLVWEHIDFNLKSEILNDKRVRHAMAYAADRERIVNTLFGNKQPVAHGTEPPKSMYHNPQVQKYDFNLSKAEALLDEAGWKRVDNDEIRSKNGKPLRLTFMTTAGNKTRERIEQLLQAQWKKVGIDVVIKNQPAKVFFGQTLRMGEMPDLAMYSWVKDPLVLSDTLWRCDYIPTKENNFLGQNKLGFCNKKADALLRAASLEIDDEKRIKIGQEFEALWSEELPALPMYFRMDVMVSKKGLQHLELTGTLQPVTWNAYQWKWQG